MKLLSVEEYTKELKQEGKAKNTIERYVRDIKEFLSTLSKETIEKEDIQIYKEKMMSKNKAITVNAKLTTVNDYIKRSGGSIKGKLLNVKKTYFTTEEEILTVNELTDLLNEAKKEKDLRLFYMIQTYIGTGIRVSEHQYITVEAIERGYATVINKGSIREVVIPRQLQKKLKGYTESKGIKEGPIFITKRGNPVDRRNIWSKMQEVGDRAGIKKNKLHPHNLRHFFARKMYRMNKDIVKLSAMLGHSAIETTRNYIKVLVSECKEEVERMEKEVEKEIERIRERRGKKRRNKKRRK